jgi:hypothetical protein
MPSRRAIALSRTYRKIVLMFFARKKALVPNFASTPEGRPMGGARNRGNSPGGLPGRHFTAIVTGGLSCPATVITNGTLFPGVTPGGIIAFT